MDVLNSEENADMKITSRYTIVIAAARRARQLIDGARALSRASSDKAVSVAINEMSQGRLIISADGESPAHEEAAYGDEE